MQRKKPLQEIRQKLHRQVNDMTKNRLKKEKVFHIVLIIAVIVVAFLAGFLISFGIKNLRNNPDVGASNGKQALESFKDISGESYVEELADLKKAKESEDVLTFLTENSIYVFDEEAIEIYVESYITAAESTAQAKGISVDKLIVEEWGYESIDAYREEAKALAFGFIKERLAVYEIAKQKNFKVTGKEYKEQLSTYANKFGYATTAEFEYACTPASIANEMLYDKTLLEF